MLVTQVSGEITVNVCTPKPATEPYVIIFFSNSNSKSLYCYMKHQTTYDKNALFHIMLYLFMASIGMTISSKALI